MIALSKSLVESRVLSQQAITVQCSSHQRSMGSTEYNLNRKLLLNSNMPVLRH
jgi:hypothetical protein